MELSLVRSLMDKDFYDDHRGARCPDRLFSKDVRKIKQSIDTAMDRYSRDVTPDEIEALFMANNPTLTTAQKQGFASMFASIKREQPMGSDIAQEVLSKHYGWAAVEPKLIKSYKETFSVQQLEAFEKDLLKNNSIKP